MPQWMKSGKRYVDPIVSSQSNRRSVVLVRCDRRCGAGGAVSLVHTQDSTRREPLVDPTIMTPPSDTRSPSILAIEGAVRSTSSPCVRRASESTALAPPWQERDTW